MSGVPETIFVEAAVVAEMGGNESKSIKKNLFHQYVCLCTGECFEEKIAPKQFQVEKYIKYKVCVPRPKDSLEVYNSAPYVPVFNGYVERTSGTLYHHGVRKTKHCNVNCSAHNCVQNILQCALEQLTEVKTRHTLYFSAEQCHTKHLFLWHCSSLNTTFLPATVG